MEQQSDYKIILIHVLSKPKLTCNINRETEEEEPAVKESKLEKKPLSIIVAPDGLPVEPFNQFLHSRLADGVVTTSTDAHALLSFQRFLSSIGKTYQSLTDDPQEGVVWQYADYLIDNTKVVCPSSGGILKNPHGYSSSTTKSYISVVINFYKWLHTNGLFFITRDKKPFAFKEVSKRFSSGINQHDVLGHISKKSKVIHTQTTDVKQRFPRLQSRQPHEKLKPMSKEHKAIFIQQIKALPNTYSNKTISLMLRLAVGSGLRVEELVTFPRLGVHLPTAGLETIPFAIGPSVDCHTKYLKDRTIDIPYELMLELNEYLNSEARDKALKKRIKHLKQKHKKEIAAQKKLHFINGGTEETFESEPFDASTHQDVPHLFVSSNGVPFAANTIQSRFSEIRADIQKMHPNWYYRVHDLRSTFATLWLETEAEKRTVVFDLLIGELASLMGHESTSTTQKYVNFMNNRMAKMEFARRKNRAAENAFKSTSKGEQ